MPLHDCHFKLPSPDQICPRGGSEDRYCSLRCTSGRIVIHDRSESSVFHRHAVRRSLMIHSFGPGLGVGVRLNNGAIWLECLSSDYFGGKDPRCSTPDRKRRYEAGDSARDWREQVTQSGGRWIWKYEGAGGMWKDLDVAEGCWRRIGLAIENTAVADLLRMRSGPDMPESGGNLLTASTRA